MDNNVIRVIKPKSYTVINNYSLDDPEISLKAKGLLAICLRKPDNWTFYATELVKHCRDGLDSVYSGLRELEEHHYIYRQRMRDDRGIFCGSMFLVFDSPYAQQGYTQETLKQLALHPHRENPDVDNPHLDNPHLGNPALLITDILPNTDIPSTEEQVGYPTHPLPEQSVLIADDPEQTDAFSNPDDYYLRTRLTDYARKKKHRAASKFASVEQKQRFRGAIAIIKQNGGQPELIKAMDYAFSRDHVTRQGVIDTLVKWAENLTRPKPAYGGNGHNGKTRLLTHEQVAARAAQNLGS